MALYSLSEGQHTLRVRATDLLTGRRDAIPTSHVWWVDRSAPTVVVLSEPQQIVHTERAQFEFECDDGAAASWTSNATAIQAGPDGSCTSVPMCSFEYRFDGRLWRRAESPLLFTNVSDNATHVVEMRATDLAGNIGPITSRTWTVDTGSPDTRMETQPQDPSDSTRAVFLFTSSSERPRALFDYRLDRSGWAYNVSSPLVLSSLSEGRHNVTVRARTRGGNVDASPLEFAWLVDLTAPATSIDHAPDLMTHLTSASFVFSANEAVRRYEYSILGENNGGDADDDGVTWVDTGNSSVVHLSGFAQGGHTVRVRATDAAGNIDSSPAEYTWIVADADSGGPPGSPVNVVATAGNGRITVVFEAPLDDGGAPITSYRITGETQYAGVEVISTALVVPTADGSLPSTSAVLSATNKLPCTFKVIATNSFGSGEESIASDSVVPFDPSDPCGLRICESANYGSTRAVPHGSCFLGEFEVSGALQSYCVCRPGYSGSACNDKWRLQRERFAWVTFPWETCSEQCGDRGTRSRQVECREFIDGIPQAQAMSNGSRCAATMPSPGTIEMCSNVPCTEEYLIVNFDIRAFYEDAATSSAMAEAFYSTVSYELSHALNVQRRRIRDINAWPSSTTLTHVSLIISPGDSADDQSIEFLAEQLRLQASTSGSALRSSGTWIRHLVPSSLIVSLGPVDAIMVTQSIMLGLVELLASLGLFLIALSACGYRLSRNSHIWLKRTDVNPFEYVVCRGDESDDDDVDRADDDLIEEWWQPDVVELNLNHVGFGEANDEHASSSFGRPKQAATPWWSMLFSAIARHGHNRRHRFAARRRRGESEDDEAGGSVELM